ncbi:hypothetical protein COT97_03225 [Candidatus Falkowbacteria bacterium CG10_big_fil_rev_8_21_14_0_10_39_11]|uniref:Uncharacterized protein n=1 Tax=Candidatus Falkowbacteria bacterium CG10_big_fil_rev_8_21_14_0_10_39_11 TaxID=1974565 RepID=A0A2H0V4T4_9BACT|nr:MAG: hypothetical protein COT97_03225 [Candidatus Falkowbacteria bacterium CG10_big_fil_rev_8_21_14_0_10_39_11]
MTRKKLGVLFLTTPFAGLISSLVLFAILNLKAKNLVDPESVPAWINVANLLLGLIGTLSVLGIIFGIPIGIYLLVSGAKKSKS